MLCCSTGLRKLEVSCRFQPHPKLTLACQPKTSFQSRVTTTRVVYARALPGSFKKNVPKAKKAESGDQKVVQDEESHAVTLVGKIATPPQELEGDRGFWFMVGDMGKENIQNLKENVAFMTHVRVPNEVYDKLIHEIVEYDNVVILRGVMQADMEFLAEEIQSPQGLSSMFDQLPTFKSIYYDITMPIKATEDDIPDDKASIFKHMMENKGDWWDMQFQVAPGSRQPDLKHRTLRKRAIWLDSMVRTSLYEQFLRSGRPLLYPGWPLLFEHPDEFWDNEPYKISPSSPTFIHKATGCPTWFDEKTASEDQVVFVKAIRTDGFAGLTPDDPWENLIAQQTDWLDVRENKSNPRAPDFRHKKYRNGIALWLDSAPEHIKEFLGKETTFKFATLRPRSNTDEWWIELFEDQSQWQDHRSRKERGELLRNYPDFKCGTDKALWLDSKGTPPWVYEKIDQLKEVVEV